MYHNETQTEGPSLSSWLKAKILGNCFFFFFVVGSLANKEAVGGQWWALPWSTCHILKQYFGAEKLCNSFCGALTFTYYDLVRRICLWYLCNTRHCWLHLPVPDYILGSRVLYSRQRKKPRNPQAPPCSPWHPLFTQRSNVLLVGPLLSLICPKLNWLGATCWL